MAVEIDLELLAGDVAGEIAAISSALETLKDRESELDGIDLEGLEIDELSGEIGNMVEMLENMELDLSELDEKINKIENLDSEIEIQASVDTPDGSTGDGDSTGSDPPDSSGGRGFNVPDVKEETYSKGSVVSSDDFLKDWLHQSKSVDRASVVGVGRSPRISNLGRNDNEFEPDSSLRELVGTRTGFGLDPVSMDHRRRDATEPKWAQDRDTLDKVLSDIGIEDTLPDLDGSADLQKNINTLSENAEEAAESVGEYEFQFLNEDRFSEELSGPEQLDTFSRADERGGMPDFDQIETPTRDRVEKQRRAMEIASGGFDFDDFNQDIRDSVPESDTDIGPGHAKTGEGFVSLSPVQKARKSVDEKSLDEIKDKFRGIGKGARRAFPKMQQIRSIIAAIIPLAIVLGAQLLGVAAAMGAVAAAGASIIGLGLLGHGESMQGSFAGAKNELRDLKEELFNVAQPTMQQFAPIQSRAFDAIPQRVGDIAESMEGLTAYEGTLFQLGGMLAEGLEYSVDAIAENEEAISQLAIRFSDIAGSSILDFFGWLFKEARKNQDMLISLASSLQDLATVVFRVFRVLVMFLNSFSPIIDILLLFSNILNTTVGQALFGFIAAAYLTVSALTTLGLTALNAYALLSGPGLMATLLPKFAVLHAHIQTLIAEYTALGNAAFWANVAMGAIGALSLGVGLLGAGAMLGGGGGGSGSSGVPASGGSGGSGQKTVYNDNRQFTINSSDGGDYADQKATEDTVRRVVNTDDKRNIPDL